MQATISKSNIQNKAEEIYARLMSRHDNSAAGRLTAECRSAFNDTLTPGQRVYFWQESEYRKIKRRIEFEHEYRYGMILGVMGKLFSSNLVLQGIDELATVFCQAMRNEGERISYLHKTAAASNKLCETLTPEQAEVRFNISKVPAADFSDLCEAAHQAGRLAGRRLASEMGLPSLSFILED
jgi:hypothetical protein